MSREVKIILSASYGRRCRAVSGDALRDRSCHPAGRRDRECTAALQPVDRVDFSNLVQFWRDFRAHGTREKRDRARCKRCAGNDGSLELVDVCGCVVRSCQLQFVIAVGRSHDPAAVGSGRCVSACGFIPHGICDACGRGGGEIVDKDFACAIPRDDAAGEWRDAGIVKNNLICASGDRWHVAAVKSRRAHFRASDRRAYCDAGLEKLRGY